MLRLALAFCLVATSAAAQDVLAQARSTYAGLQGEWAEPSKSCTDPADTWLFNPGTVRAGLSMFDLLGIGGGGGAVRVDLVSRASGARVPLNLVPRGDVLDVTGSGIAVSLRRCDSAAFEPQVAMPDEGITSRPLDEETPSDPVATDDTPNEDVAEALSAEDAFAARFTGAWSSLGGACDWRLSDSRITAAGESYDIVNYSGEPDRIGIQALRSDGTPATFTVTPSGSGAQVSGKVAEGDDVSASLSPC